MKDNDWRGQLQEIIEEETDMERPMIPRYAKGYAKLVLEDFISSEIEKAREEGRRERIEIYSRYMELREKEKHTYFEDKDIDELNKLESELSKLKDSNMEKEYWTTKDGEKIAIEDMETSHIKNCIEMIDKSASGGLRGYRVYAPYGLTTAEDVECASVTDATIYGEEVYKYFGKDKYNALKKELEKRLSKLNNK